MRTQLWGTTPLFHYCLSFILWVAIYEVRKKLKDEVKNLLLILYEYTYDSDPERKRHSGSLNSGNGVSLHFKNNFPGLFKEQCINTWQSITELLQSLHKEDKKSLNIQSCCTVAVEDGWWSRWKYHGVYYICNMGEVFPSNSAPGECPFSS